MIADVRNYWDDVIQAETDNVALDGESQHGLDARYNVASPAKTILGSVLSPITSVRNIMSLTTANPAAQTVQFLSLPEILADGIALGYFFDYLRKARALKNLQFWLACAQLLELAETNPEVPCNAVTDVQLMSKVRTTDQSKLQVDKSTVAQMDAVNCGNPSCASTAKMFAGGGRQRSSNSISSEDGGGGVSGGNSSSNGNSSSLRGSFTGSLGAVGTPPRTESPAPSGGGGGGGGGIMNKCEACSGTIKRERLACFVRAQEQVYTYLLNTHYRTFTFSEAYRTYIKHASQAGGGGGGSGTSPTKKVASVAVKGPVAVRHDGARRRSETGRPITSASPLSSNPALGFNIAAEWCPLAQKLDFDGSGAAVAAGDEMLGADAAESADGLANLGMNPAGSPRTPKKSGFLERRRSQLADEIKMKTDVMSALQQTSSLRKDGRGGSASNTGLPSPPGTRRRSSAASNSGGGGGGGAAVGKEASDAAEELQDLQDELRVLELQEERTERWTSQMGEWNAVVESVWSSPAKGEEAFAVLAINRADDPGWITTRTHSEFVKLHKQLKECVDWLPKNLPWKQASKSLFSSGKLSAEQLEKQRLELQDYMNAVLQDEILCFSEVLFEFLSLAEGSASLSFASNVATAALSDGDPDEGKESDSMAEPLYMMINEVFVLKGVFKFVRRQFVNFIQLAYGRTINGYVRDQFESVTNDESLVEYLEMFQDIMFPEEEYVEPEQKSQAQRSATMDEAREAFLNNLPDVLKSLVGSDNSRQGAEKVFKAMQNTHINRHLFYMLFEKFLEHLLPNEMDWRNLADELVELDIRSTQPESGII